MQNISYGEFNKINSISFTSEYGKLKNIKLEGSTSQATRSGRNKFNINDTEARFGNVEFNISDSKLTLTATGTTGAQIVQNIIKGLDSSQNYTFSCKGKKVVSGTEGLSYIAIAIYGSNDDTNYTHIQFLEQRKPVIATEYSFIKTLTGYTSYRFYIYNNSSTPVTVGEKTEYYDMQFLEGTYTKETIPEYEQYGASPSPDYPSPIENVEGKNKFNKNTTVSGYIEFKNGQFTSNNVYTSSDFIEIDENKNYYCNYTCYSSDAYGMAFYDKDKNYISGSMLANSFVTPSNAKYYRFCVRNENYKGSYITDINTVQLEEGTTATDYVPYNSLEIKNVGKNKFDCANSRIVYNNGNTSYKRLDNGLKLISNGVQYNMIYFLVDTVKNLKDKTLTLSSDISFSKEKQYVDFGLYYTDFNGGNRKSFGIIKSIKTEGYYAIKGIVEEGENRNYVCIGLRPNMDSNFASGDYTIYDNLQVEIGETATDYEPHKSQTTTFPLENQKLMEGSYLASDGIHHKRKQVVLNGSESWSLSSGTNRYSFWLRNSTISNMVNAWNYKLSNYFKYENKVYSTASIPCIAENTAGANPMLIFNTDGSQGTTISQWKTWLSQNPITVEYELAEEEIVPYTEAQQEAWNKIENFPIFIGQNNLTSTALLSAIYIKKITTDTKVDYNLYNEDYIKIATKNNIHPKFKIQMLDEYENVIDEVTGDISRDNSGSISNNYQQGVRRSVSLTFIDTEGKFLPDSNSNLIWANKKFKLFSGLLDTDTNEIFWFSEGVYYFSNVSSSRNGADKLITVNGVDKFGKFGSELGYNQLESTYLIPAGTKIYDAIKGILNIDIGNGYPIDPIEPILDPLYIDEVCPYDISKSPSSYLSEMLIELADIIGCDIYYDADGRLHVDSGTIDFSYSNRPSIWDFSDVLPEYMNPSITTNFAEFINTVKVVGNNTNDKTYEYTAVNNNPESPTRVDLIGTKSTYIESASVYNTDRAKDYAKYKLNMFSILQLAVTFSCTFLPHLDVNKVITITDNYYKYEKQRFVIQSITLPLSYDGVMSISACNVASLPYYEGGN